MDGAHFFTRLRYLAKVGFNFF